MTDSPWHSLSKKKPKVGQKIAILTKHWKGNTPLSMEISFAEVFEMADGTLLAVNCDWSGYGAQQWKVKGLRGQKGTDPELYEDEIYAWADWQDIPGLEEL